MFRNNIFTNISPFGIDEFVVKNTKPMYIFDGGENFGPGATIFKVINRQIPRYSLFIDNETHPITEIERDGKEFIKIGNNSSEFQLLESKCDCTMNFGSSEYSFNTCYLFDLPLPYINSTIIYTDMIYCFTNIEKLNHDEIKNLVLDNDELRLNADPFNQDYINSVLMKNGKITVTYGEWQQLYGTWKGIYSYDHDNLLFKIKLETMDHISEERNICIRSVTVGDFRTKYESYKYRITFSEAFVKGYFDKDLNYYF